MLYLNQLSSVVKDFLTFDGINDYVIVDQVYNESVDILSTPFTLFTSIKLNPQNGMSLASSLAIVKDSGFVWCFLEGQTFIGFVKNYNWLTYWVLSIDSNLWLNRLNISITYDGLKTSDSLKLYINAEPIPVTTPNGGNLATTTVTTNNQVVIGRYYIDSLAIPWHIRGKIYNQSMVTYAKTLAEIQQDNTDKKQSLDTNKGEYLYNVVFNHPDNVTTFQTEEAVPKTVTIFR